MGTSGRRVQGAKVPPPVAGIFDRVQGSSLVPELHLGCVFTRKAPASSGLIQNLEPIGFK